MFWLCPKFTDKLSGVAHSTIFAMNFVFSLLQFEKLIFKEFLIVGVILDKSNVRFSNGNVHFSFYVYRTFIEHCTTSRRILVLFIKLFSK